MPLSVRTFNNKGSEGVNVQSIDMYYTQFLQERAAFANDVSNDTASTFYAKRTEANKTSTKKPDELLS